jgi:hypothetical protein
LGDIARWSWSLLFLLEERILGRKERDASFAEEAVIGPENVLTEDMLGEQGRERDAIHAGDRDTLPETARVELVGD